MIAPHWVRRDAFPVALSARGPPSCSFSAISSSALDLEDFEPLPAPKATTIASKFDRRVRYFHNQREWEEYDVDYHRLTPPKSEDDGGGGSGPLAPRALPEFYRAVSDFLQTSRANHVAHNSKTCIALFDSRGGLGAAAYLVACHMCATMRAPVHAAIEALMLGSPSQTTDPNSHRKWGIRDVRLIKDLQTRFKGNRELRIEGGTPGWWLSKYERKSIFHFQGWGL